MKSLLRMGLCVALLSSVAFARNPQEHRGFYFSAGIGPAYLSYQGNEEYSDYRYSYGESGSTYTPTRVKEEGSYDAFIFPALDFRFGKSAFNLLVFYTTFDLMMDTGNWEAKYEETSEDSSYYDSYKADADRSYLLSFGGGLGFDIYPFLNPHSVLRGFHLGESVSVEGVYIDAFGSDVSQGGGVAIANRINVGMDWWVSDTWSMGVEFSYTNFSYSDGNYEDASQHLFRLMFRLTRG